MRRRQYRWHYIYNSKWAIFNKRNSEFERGNKIEKEADYELGDAYRFDSNTIGFKDKDKKVKLVNTSKKTIKEFDFSNEDTVLIDDGYIKVYTQNYDQIFYDRDGKIIYQTKK